MRASCALAFSGRLDIFARAAIPLTAIGLLIALLVMAPPATAQQTSSAAEPSASADAARWPYALPFLANEAVKRGYDLPLPRGLSALFYYVERDISISDVRIGVDGAPRGASAIL